jgi:hypothetical protein
MEMTEGYLVAGMGYVSELVYPVPIELSDYKGIDDFDPTGAMPFPEGLYPKHSTASVADPDNPNHVMTLFGGGHFTNPDNPLFDIFEYEFEEWLHATRHQPERRVLVVEGTSVKDFLHALPPGYAGPTATHWSDRSRADGEKQYMADLAAKYNIPILRADQMNQDEAHPVVELFIYMGNDREYVLEQTLLYYAGRWGAQIHREGRQAETQEIMRDVISQLRESWLASGTTFNNVGFSAEKHELEFLSYENFLRIYSATYQKSTGEPRSYEDDVRSTEGVQFILKETVGHMFRPSDDPQNESMVSRISRLVNGERDRHFKTFFKDLFIADGLSPFGRLGVPHVDKIADDIKALGEPLPTSMEHAYFPTVDKALGYLGLQVSWDEAARQTLNAFLEKESWVAAQAFSAAKVARATSPSMAG